MAQRKPQVWVIEILAGDVRWIPFGAWPTQKEAEYHLRMNRDNGFLRVRK